MMTPFRATLALGLFGLTACQTAPVKHSGYLTSYEGLKTPDFSLREFSPRAAIHKRRDDQASDALQRVYLQPAALAESAGEALDQDERTVVLREVDRRICYQLSRRFTIVPRPAPDSGTVRTIVSEIKPTGRVGSGVSAVAGYFNPVPLVDVRVPGTTGGLAVESELLGADGKQIAAVIWAHDATVVGREAPSLSPIGDALQLTENMSHALVKAFTTKQRKRRSLEDFDPCAEYGPRINATRWVASKGLGYATGLWQPEVAGVARPEEDAIVTEPAPQ